MSVLCHFVVVRLAQLSSGWKKLLVVGVHKQWKSRIWSHTLTFAGGFDPADACWQWLFSYIYQNLCSQSSPLGCGVLPVWRGWSVGHPVWENKLEEILLIFLAFFKVRMEFHAFLSLFTWQGRASQSSAAGFSLLQMFLWTAGCPRCPNRSSRGMFATRASGTLCICVLWWLWALHLVSNKTLMCAGLEYDLKLFFFCKLNSL